MTEIPSEGDVATYSRTFTTEDVEQFGELSGDRGSHHETDTPMVHGLLTATLPTKLGGDLDQRFRFARVSGPSAKHDEQQVGVEHELADEDVLRLVVRR